MTIEAQKHESPKIEASYAHNSRDLCIRYYSRLTTHTLWLAPMTRP